MRHAGCCTTPRWSQHRSGRQLPALDPGLLSPRPAILPCRIQSLFNALGEEAVGTTIGVGGDGRYFNKEAVQTILKLAAGNGVAKVVVGKDAIMATPAMSALIRRRGLYGGLIMSASHNPGGPGERRVRTSVVSRAGGSRGGSGNCRLRRWQQLLALQDSTKEPAVCDAAVPHRCLHTSAGMHRSALPQRVCPPRPLHSRYPQRRTGASSSTTPPASPPPRRSQTRSSASRRPSRSSRCAGLRGMQQPCYRIAAAPGGAALLRRML